MAIEDALQLASSLLHHNGISSAALSHYEYVRKERVTPIWQESTRQAMSYYKQKEDADNPMKMSGGVDSKNLFAAIVNYQPPSLTREHAGVHAIV